jgi:hypothetical protein
LLLRAFIGLLLLAVELRWRGFGRLVAEAGGRPAQRRERAPAEALALARRYARGIEVAARYQPRPARCLHRALLLHRWLRADGLASELHIGVRKEGRALLAHAWVSVDGEVVTDPAPAIAPFRPLLAIGGERPSGPGHDGERAPGALVIAEGRTPQWTR